MGGVTRMTRSLPLMVAAVVLVMVAVLGAGGVVTWRAGRTLGALHSVAADADRVTDLGESLLIDLLDAESSARAYVLTKRPVYLEPYAAARAAAAVSLAQLSDAARQFAPLAADMQALQSLVIARLALLDHGLQTVDAGSPQSVQGLIGSDAGRETMRQTRALIEMLVQHAARERDSRAEEEQRHEQTMRVRVMLGGVFGVLLLGAASLLLLGGRHRLLRAQQAMAAQSALWQATVENLQDGVAVFDAAGRLLQWNANLAPLTGLPADLLHQGTPFAAFAAAAAQWQPPILANADAAMGQAVEVRNGAHVLEVWRNTMPGGGHMLTVGDITRRVAAESIALQAQKMDVLGQLTGGVAHDFNNLLQVVSANLDLMSNRLAAGEVPAAAWLRSRLQAAMEGVNRGARLTRHLLAFARRQPLAPEPIDAALLLGALEDMLRRTLGPTVALEQIIASSLWGLRADPQQLENALLNLAINARDAMADNPPHQSRLTIEARNTTLDEAYCAANQEVSPGHYVMIAVSDSGCGMTADQIARAVEPFYTTKPEGHGTGLGLSMVYGFAKQSGGHLKLYSEPGHGTTVRLYIPRTQAAAPVYEAAPGSPEAGRGEVILLVEDDTAVRQAAALALSGLGYRVEEAETADAALLMLEQGLVPDLVFTDVMMPGVVSARAMTERARALIPGLAVVFTSGYTENSIVHKGQLDPDVQLISKPWRIEDLASHLRTALDRARRRPTGRLRILLVEDDALVRMITADMLADMGHEVVEAEDAEEAQRLIEGIGLLITDIGLGRTDGLAMAAAIRAQRPDLPVIVASGRARPDDLAAGLVWLHKPYDSVALKAALDEVALAVPI